jgi:hypothetical protein
MILTREASEIERALTMTLEVLIYAYLLFVLVTAIVEGF